MKIESKSSENHASFFLRFKIPFVEKTFRIHSLIYNTPNAWVRGYSSRTENGRYVLFHDYDALDFEAVVADLKYLQKKFKLSDYYIFKTDREDSFHAVCLDTFCLSDAYQIQKESSSDLAFIHSIDRLKTKEWILRVGTKGDRGAPSYYKSVDSGFDCHVKSSAHAEFLRKWGVPVGKSGKWDGCELLAIVDYNTANRIK